LVWDFEPTPGQGVEGHGTPRSSRRRSWPELEMEEVLEDHAGMACQASPTKVQRCDSLASSTGTKCGYSGNPDLDVGLVLQTPEPKHKATGTTPPPAPNAALLRRQLRSEVHAAIKMQSVPLVQLALSRAGQLGSAARCDHMLHEAIQGQHVRALAFLLEQGAEDSLEGLCGGLTPLQRAVRAINRKDDGAYEMASALLHHAARTDVAAPCGSTPLHDAARNLSLAAVTLLLSHRADPNALDRHGHTALHVACSRTLLAAERDVRMVTEVLLRAGADPMRRDANGARPSDLYRGARPLGTAGPLLALLMREERWWSRRPALLVRQRSNDQLLSQLPEMLFQAVVRFL